jgi:hypothetical protein
MTPETLDWLTKVCVGFEKVAAQLRTETHEVLSTTDHVEVIKHFDHMRKAVERIKIAREAIQEITDRLSKEQIPDLFRLVRERTGEKPPFKIEGVGSVNVSNKYSCTILDKDAGYNWLRKNGHEGLITETVNASTLSAFAKELIEVEGKELPPELFKTGLNPYTSIRAK